jgi:hypothetical protein
MAETPAGAPAPKWPNACSNPEDWIGSGDWLVTAKLSVTLMVQFLFPRAFEFHQPFTMFPSSGWNP